MSMQIPWKEGEGNIVITPGSNGTASVSSDVANEGLDREQTVVFRTTNSGVRTGICLHYHLPDRQETGVCCC